MSGKEGAEQERDEPRQTSLRLLGSLTDRSCTYCVPGTFYTSSHLILTTIPKDSCILQSGKWGL